MSDFDREAEREKLREKYERDKEKREASERMSELLLQGATMTNRHCPECHSPVFRYEGRQFCPTCEKEVTEGGALETESDADGAEPSSSDGADGDAEGQADAGATDGDADGTTAESGGSASGAAVDDDTSGAGPSDRPADGRREPTPETPDRPTADDAPTPAGERRPAKVQPPTPRGERSPDRRDREPTDGDRRRTDSGSETGGEFRDAEASLRREIGSLTRRVEETRDVGRKRDLLAAAKEAAETLEAIRRL
jgi:uncharacterized Zn finger protein (UPF0148 family)